jgi:hypothetical protein
MPHLRDVNLCGLFSAEYDMWETSLTWAQARGLAAALAGATALTSLALESFEVQWGGMDVGWGSVLQQLTGLQALSLGIGPSDEDLLHLVRLAQLTALSLSGPGSYSDGPLSTLLESLTALQQLAIQDSSGLRSCAVFFGAVTQLRDLRKLNIFRNGAPGPEGLVCELESFVQLTTLTALTELELSHATSETVTEADAAAFRELMPQLANFRCSTKSSEPASVMIRSSWDEVDEEVVVDEMDIEE